MASPGRDDEMSPTTISTETLTFLFTDIEGSTRLWERDPEGMKAALGRHDRVVRQAIESHGGGVFKTSGDAFAAVFRVPVDAARAAIDAQDALARPT